MRRELANSVSDRPRDVGVQAERNNEGMALVLALLFVTLLAAMVVDFTYEMQVSAAFVENQSGGLEAYIAAKSAVAGGLGLLSSDLFGGLGDLAADGSSSTQTQTLPGGDGQIFDSYEDIWAEGIAMTPMNDAVMQCTIDDEYGKINLNALLTDDGTGQEVPVPELARMIDAILLDRDPEQSPLMAIIDWLDADDEVSDPDGAEYDYYEGLENPYGCKNGPMDSIQELLLIPGITPEMYFGNPEEEIPPLSDLLTVHGHPQGKINMNTADYMVLYAYFEEVLESPEAPALADDVLLRIEEQGPFLNVQEMQEYFGVQDPGGNGTGNQAQPPVDPNDPTTVRTNLFDVASSCFRIYGDGQSGDARVRIEAYVYRDTMDDGPEQTFRILDWRVYR